MTKYIVDGCAWQELCNGIPCSACHFSKDGLCIFESYIRNQHVYEEKPQGEWNYIQAGMAVCPFCGATPHNDYKNFCAKCGALMSANYRQVTGKLNEEPKDSHAEYWNSIGEWKEGDQK